MSYTGLVERLLLDIREDCLSETRQGLLRKVDAAIEALTRPVDVEAVARAIWRSLTADVEHDVRANEVTPAELRKIAQAALAAMETPHADG